ncbi:hypothetical protein AMS68_002851 [Peltaster fructicola]|uniref:Uncharacterized protein n=1 Tax=Peltaster fructicola TaxID=286661 RepID=A0A6H0XRH7_9PEZI|nr:hypothetical protein AMS68_002851 [Peltaster fructicola]
MDSGTPTRRTTAKRPESTIAQNFAADLDSMFGLTPEVDGLEHNVNQKKTSITTSNMELQELEARLKAMEDRLAKVSRSSSPARPPPPIPQMRDEQQVLGASSSNTQRTSPLAQRPTYPADRPPTAPSRRPPMPPDAQNMPGQFPAHMQQYNTSNEYVMVESHSQDRYR